MVLVLRSLLVLILLLHVVLFLFIILVEKVFDNIQESRFVVGRSRSKGCRMRETVQIQ